MGGILAQSRSVPRGSSACREAGFQLRRLGCGVIVVRGTSSWRQDCEENMSDDPTTSDNSTATARPRAKAHWGRDLALIVLVGLACLAIAWRSGAVHSKPKIAILTSTEDVYWDRLFQGADSGAAYFDAQITKVRCPTDDAVQTQKIRDLMAQGVDGIIVSPVKPEAQTALFNEVAAKMPLITVDSDSPKSNRIAFIGTNNYEAGRQCGDLIRSALPDGGQVVLCVGSVESDNGRQRRQGLIDNLLDRPKDDSAAMDPIDKSVGTGKYTVVATLLDGADPGKAKSLAVD